MNTGSYLLSMDNRSEQILLDQARDGNMRSFEQLMQANSAAVYRHALRMVGNTADAEDLTQEAFLRLHRSLARFRGDARVATWLYRTVSRLAIDQLRKEKLKRAFFFTGRKDDLIEQVEQAVDTAPSAQTQLLQREQQQEVLKVMQHLSPRQRAVFSLRHFEERPLKEIAEILELELGTVKTHLHRATCLLREELRGDTE